MKSILLVSMLLCFSSTISFAHPLPADEVFQVSTNLVDPNNFVIKWQIKSGYFLYRDRISVINNSKNSNVELGNTRFPVALKKTDKQGHTYLVYRKQLLLPVAILGKFPGETILVLHYQGCSDDGFCYPPETREIKLNIDNTLALTAVKLYDADNIHNTKSVSASLFIEPGAESSYNSNNNTGNLSQINNIFYASAPDTMESVFLNHHWFMILIIFFGFGLLLSCTPCVLPMVPVLSGIIIGHSDTISTRKAFFLSLSYVLSMAITYAIVGAIVALLGSNLQIIMQSPWAIGLFSMLFVLLAASTFGYFELKLPISWQAKLAKMNYGHESGYYINAAIMGCLSTLILSPCVTAPLIGVLSYIAHNGNVFMGAVSLFFLSLGMGAPLLLLGTSAGHWLPKTGRWMNGIKSFFGFLLLAVAINLLGRIVPASIGMNLWAILLIVAGIYAGALIPAYSHCEKARQATGIILFVYGLLLLIGASMGNVNPLQPLANLAVNISSFDKGNITTKTNSVISNNIVKTDNEVQKAIGNNTDNKPIILDFYADWCLSCQIIEATTLKNPDVLAALQHFLVLKVDITANNLNTQALMRHYDIIAPPTFLFLDSKGKELTQLRLVGDIGSGKFLSRLKKSIP